MLILVQFNGMMCVPLDGAEVALNIFMDYFMKIVTTHAHMLKLNVPYGLITH